MVQDYTWFDLGKLRFGLTLLISEDVNPMNFEEK